MRIIKVQVTVFEQNARILLDESSKIAAVVDPGGEVDRILATLEEEAVSVDSIILTHAHIDHGGGVEELEEKLFQRKGKKPKLLAHPLEQQLRGSINQQAVLFGLPPTDFRNVREPDVYIDEGDQIEIGSLKAKVMFTPGHSPGHISLYFESEEPVLIAGDTLFFDSIGRTDLPGGNYETLMNSIRDKLLPLPGQTKVMSGHGPDTTIEREKAHNPFLK